MRVFDLEIERKSYKVCCGLKVLGELQKTYGSLTEFEKKILPYKSKNNDENTDEKDDSSVLDSDTEELESKIIDIENIDIVTVFDTAKLFLEEGAYVSDIEVDADKVLRGASDPYGLAFQLFDVYVKSMKPDNGEDEKNVMSQGTEG